ncbi:hypothetical protein [Ectobacillus ponti]|uniref:Uncharacterized protein n=1 Tax=Ectobacillus ponti TaxID=2961894 RepID=A0AA41X812_9BACI|nr:hypothetical protein [Ectobacillus ponti]MCP8970604.1 hypothetical protein [Ectobacillus ponti]
MSITMNEKLELFKSRLGREHKDIVKYVEHVFTALDVKLELHQRENAQLALHGAKIDGKAEREYEANIRETKRLLLAVLEQTAQDYEHLGDKHWAKYFRDGIDG